ncbi:uncharacterized protein KD926_009548 [Aspergillus affinis]|uniref:uncharacterized protein n=1 Tax=Aspergillus affinis TaxID=1070780 RepID=UPI0022FDEB42|nr:uncharacterized protein KD926_009548 [Aspergillus affinis]KAI9045134.1 hypothetical protein KD926_009548 [Aspergillus affinis]
MAPPMVTTVRAVVATVAILTLLVCSLRLYLRKFITRAFGLDDCLVILALILVLLFAALSIYLTFFGIGRHMDTVPEDQLPTMQYAIYISLCTYLFVASAVKISLLVFIMRAFPTKLIRWLGLTIVGFLVLLTISGELPLILQCSPVSAAYDKTVPNYKCFPSDTMFDIEMYQGVLMFAVDLAIFALPIPTIWKLQMPLKRRLTIIGLFALGLVACVAGLARLPTLVYQKDDTDFTYSGATPLIWMNVEFGLALTTGSLPSLRILLRRIPGFSSDKSESKELTGGNANGNSGFHLRDQKRWTSKIIGKGRDDVESLASESQERIFRN